jgi:hypothetical protein
MLTFFNTGYKFFWDIVQNVKGRQIQYIKLTPTNGKDQRKEILLGIDIQTKNIYNLIEVGKNGRKPHSLLILLKPISHYQKISLPLTRVNTQNTTSIS